MKDSMGSEPHQPRCIIQVSDWQAIQLFQYSPIKQESVEDSAVSVIERRAEPWVTWQGYITCALHVA